MLKHLVLSFCAAAFLSGCGALGGYTACDFREGSLNGKENRCQERNGISATTFKGACSASGGKPSDGRCPGTGVVGGCNLGMQGDGTEVFDWFYTPMTQAQAKSECGSNGFVEAYK